MARTVYCGNLPNISLMTQNLLGTEGWGNYVCLSALVPSGNTGFAKSRPAAQQPAAHGPPLPEVFASVFTARHGPAARRPSGPRPTARGPRPTTARRPGGPEAHTVLLSSGKSTHMHRFSSGLGAQMKDGEFEFVYHFNNHFDLFFRCMLPSEKRCHSLLFSSVYNNKQKQGFK